MKYPSKTSHKLYLTIMLIYIYALILLCSPAPALALTLPDTAKLLPPDTIVLIDVHDFSQLKKQIHSCLVYSLSGKIKKYAGIFYREIFMPVFFMN